MGILDGILRVIGGKGKDEEKKGEVPDLNKETPVKARVNPWFNRVNLCPGSGTPMVGMKCQKVDKYRAGKCPTCKRTLRVTLSGNSWNHQKPTL